MKTGGSSFYYSFKGRTRVGSEQVWLLIGSFVAYILYLY